MTSFQSSELTELPVVENSQLFAQRVHSARTAHGTPPVFTPPQQFIVLRQNPTHTRVPGPPPKDLALHSAFKQ